MKTRWHGNLEEKGILFEKLSLLDVYYKDQLVGQYKADLIVEGKLIIELKAVPAFNDRHKAQILNYLRATGLNVGLLLNFGMPRLGIQRIVWKYDETNNI